MQALPSLAQLTKLRDNTLNKLELASAAKEIGVVEVEVMFMSSNLNITFGQEILRETEEDLLILLAITTDGLQFIKEIARRQVAIKGHRITEKWKETLNIGRNIRKYVIDHEMNGKA